MCESLKPKLIRVYILEIDLINVMTTRKLSILIPHRVSNSKGNFDYAKILGKLLYLSVTFKYPETNKSELQILILAIYKLKGRVFLSLYSIICYM